MRSAVVLLVAGACWVNRANPPAPTAAPMRPQTHDERFASISIAQIEGDLRLGRLASFLSGPLVSLDEDAGELRVLCGDDARRLVEQISTSFTDPARAGPRCEGDSYGYELMCGQMWFPPGQPRRMYELRAIELVIERDGEIRLESARTTLHGSVSFQYFVHAFREAKQHARCPP